MAVADGTTVELQMDGKSTGPIPLDEFAERAKTAVEHAGGYDPYGDKQLSFDVGLPGDVPSSGSVKIGGSFGIRQDLAYRREVRLVLSTLDGEILVDTQLKVTGVSFKQDAHNYTERIHTLG